MVKALWIALGSLGGLGIGSSYVIYTQNQEVSI